MKSFNNGLGLLVIAFSTAFTTCSAQTDNSKTETVKIYGNCGMCEKTIEKTGSKENIAQVDWDNETKMAKITFDASKTSLDEILQRIAVAGYDSDKFRASDKAYKSLNGCCQYDRPKK